MKKCLIFLLVAMSWSTSLLAQSSPNRPNILFIAVDDLNDWVGPLGGHPAVKTPSIDRLAKRGTTFLNAHCQAPLCNPSRTSLLLGLRPSTTGIYALEPWFRSVKELKDRVPLTEHLKLNGYRTCAVGKLWHGGFPPARDRNREFHEIGQPEASLRRPPKPFTDTPAHHPLMDWGAFPPKDQDHPDYKVADWAVNHLRSPNLNRGAQPFFLAVGFALPHVPCYAPPKWFDLYPENDALLPKIKKDDRDDIPFFAWRLHWKLPEPRLEWLQQSKQWLPLVRSYLASISFMDAQVGRVLEALKASGQEDNTIVVFWGDHGWHLGEKGISGKNTLWERSTRVPLIFAGPGVTPNASSPRPAELLDLYPTLIELCQLPPRPGLEGLSLAPQLKDAQAPRSRPAITTHGPNNHGVRTEQWRYIRYADGSEELYDMVKDPNEWTNLASDPKHANTKNELAKWLPKKSAPPVPGSKSRLVEIKNGVFHWETEPVNVNTPVPEITTSNH